MEVTICFYYSSGRCGGGGNRVGHKLHSRKGVSRIVPSTIGSNHPSDELPFFRLRVAVQIQLRDDELR